MTGAVAGLSRAQPEASPRALRIGVVGAGRIGALHAELLSRDVPGAELAAVCDPVPARAAELPGRLAVGLAADGHELIADDAIDAVAICSSTDTHPGFIDEA